MTKTELSIDLNVQELGVIISALELLDFRDENQIAKDYGSAPSLYNRLNEIYGQNGPNNLVVQKQIQFANLHFNYGQESKRTHAGIHGLAKASTQRSL